MWFVYGLFRALRPRVIGWRRCVADMEQIASAFKIFLVNASGRDCLGDLRVYGKIILKSVFYK
jgi:hypothetical protein